MSSSVDITSRTPYRVRAESVEACNCRHGCNCQFEGFPNEGKCEFIIGYEVIEGRFGDTKLDGLRAVIAAKYPNAIHEGHGHVVLFVDGGASDSQVDALVSIVSGKMGGMPWGSLGGTIERFEGPVRKSVHIKVAGERSEVQIPGVVELDLTPLRDVVTGDEKEVHLTFPKGGFF